MACDPSHVFTARDLDCADLDGKDGRSNTTRSQVLPLLAASSAKDRTPALMNDIVSPRPFTAAFFVAVRTARVSLSTCSLTKRQRETVAEG